MDTEDLLDHAPANASESVASRREANDELASGHTKSLEDLLAAMPSQSQR